MKRLIVAVAALTLLAAPVLAQPMHRDDHPADNGAMMHGPGNHMNNHADWHEGGKIGHDDWNRGTRVDYRSHHLRQPPRGYEWRQVDNNYVLAAAATGLIAGIALAQ